MILLLCFINSDGAVVVSPSDVNVFVIGINEFGVLEVLVFVTLADGTIAPAGVLLNVVTVSS